MSRWDVIHGDALEVTASMEPGSVDAVVTDPPYALAFMGQQWDTALPGAETWRAVLRIAKPGAHLLAFGGTRTFHRLTCAIEDAGWEVRDCLSWLYGSGFPKSHNLDGDWSGWGTALKPAWEPIVLADGRRVLTQRGLQAALGLSRSGGKGGARRLAAFLASLGRKGMNTKDLSARAGKEIWFTPKPGATAALAYEAIILEEVCQLILDADAAGKLAPNQKPLSERARILQRGFAQVGVIALVDEATGFQRDRPAYALAEILDAFIAKELRPWVRRFPFEFYQEIFRLKSWDTSDLTPNSPKPIEVGRITVDVIYKRAAPVAVYKTMRKLTPRSEKGYLINKLHLWLSADIGDPKLAAHIDKVIAVMKLSEDWADFMRNLERAGIHKFTDNMELPFERRSLRPPSDN